MADDKRTEREIIDEAYSDEAARTWRAPVQGYEGTIPWPLHLEAYDAYQKRWSRQTALIDLKGRGCRGGFHVGELDQFIPDWRDRVTYIGRLEKQLADLNWQPINTAPKGNDEDGPFFEVAWAGEDRHVIDCHRVGDTIKLKHGYPAIWTVFNPQPTHWRPKAELPK